MAKSFVFSVHSFRRQSIYYEPLAPPLPYFDIIVVIENRVFVYGERKLVWCLTLVRRILWTVHKMMMNKIFVDNGIALEICYVTELNKEIVNSPTQIIRGRFYVVGKLTKGVPQNPLEFSNAKLVSHLPHVRYASVVTLLDSVVVVVAWLLCCHSDRKQYRDAGGKTVLYLIFFLIT